MISSHIPGCLNGLFAKDSSSACAAFDYFTAKTADTNVSHTVRMGAGKQLMLRQKTGASISNGKLIKVLGWNGSSVSVNMRTWLTKDPLGTYESAAPNCKATSTVGPTIVTGSQETLTTTTTVWGKTTTTTRQQCKIDPNSTYYFGIDFPEAVSGSSARFQVDESASDFLR